MKFRTEIEKFELKHKINYGTKIFTIGSCFAQNIAKCLERSKFRVTQSPLGISFNPESILSTLRAYTLQSPANLQRIVRRGDSWVSLDAHSEICGSSESELLQAYNQAITEGHDALHAADCLIITFGTAWIYTHIATAQVVANCHKVGNDHFTRSRMNIEQIVNGFEQLFNDTLRDKRIILTLSPVRHIGDGLIENSTSKAILRVAIDQLCERCDNVEYFPAYECLNDDLRDYRFYADDLAHPSTQAIDYIWERFIDSTIDGDTKALLSKVEKIVSAAAHRPLNAQSEEYKAFCQKFLEIAKSIKEVDFSRECAFFEQYCHKS